MGGVLALIPARSGSRGLPDKNIRPFLGVPLLVHSIRHAQAARSVDRILVSTDSEEYAALARTHGAEVPFLRPGAIAGDLATDLEVFVHALTWLREHERADIELCVHLRPTHPIRDPGKIDEAVSILRADPTLDSVRSVVPVSKTPLKMWWRGGDGLLAPVATLPQVPEAYNEPRQRLPEAFMQNASIDVVRSRVVLDDRSMTGRRIHGLVTEASYDIDSLDDFVAAEHMARLYEPGRRAFVIDIDGVLAGLTVDNDYRRAEPLRDNIALVNRLHALGHRITLFTARGSQTGLDWEEVTRAQLALWGVAYDELRFGKPAADGYVDDRSVSLAVLRRIYGGAS